MSAMCMMTGSAHRCFLLTVVLIAPFGIATMAAVALEQDQDFYDKLPEPGDDENDMLDLAYGLSETCVALTARLLWGAASCMDSGCRMPGDL